MVSRHREGLPMLDIAYSYATSVAMIAATVVTWVGYTLIAVQIMVWWTIQLAAITTITCLYHLMELFENRYMLGRIKPELRAAIRAGEELPESAKPVLLEMERGEHITKTWVYDLFRRTLVPIMAVLSVLISIYWAAEVFELTSVCENAFYRNFVDQPDLIQISIFKLCQVAALWFIFSYLNYAVRSFSSEYKAFHAESSDSPLGMRIKYDLLL